jgi:hypothetical protein
VPKRIGVANSEGLKLLHRYICPWSHRAL